MKKFSSFCGIALLGLTATSAFAAVQTCAILSGGSADSQTVSSAYTAGLAGQANEGCNVLITFGASGAITTTNPNAAPSYDSGSDDNLVGIVNNSGGTLTTLTISGVVDADGDGPFDFDGDGICNSGWTFSGAGPSGCSTKNNSLTSGADYANSGSITFGTPTCTGSCGTGATETDTVTFTGGLASGSTAFFSLEQPVDLSHPINVSTPEPSALLSLLCMGLGLGLGGKAKRKFFS
jgi:hypothetical protein